MPRAAPKAAKLVREAAAALADDMASVGFAISHWLDRDIRFEQTLAAMDLGVPDMWNAQSPDGRVLWTETLTTVVYGVATVIVAARTAGHLGGDLVPEFQVKELRAGKPSQDAHSFYGLAHPNPSFLYRGVNELELLVTVPASDRSQRIGDALVLCQAVKEISSIAKKKGLPLLLVLSPMAEPPTEDEPWPEAQTAGVRCGIALPSGGIDVEIEICTRMYEWADRQGCGLYVGDRRGDGRRGLWHQLRAGDLAVYEERIRGLPRQDETLGWAVPVTFVGPARVGTTAAIMTYLAQCRIPILAISVTPLENMAFISLLVGLTDPVDNPFSPAQHDTAETMLKLMGKLRLAPEASDGAETQRANSAAPPDYRACAGPVLAVSPLDPDRRAIWAAWQFPEATGAPHTAITQLRIAAEQEVGEGKVNAQYIVCRRGESQDLRGRCKLAVPLEVEPPSAEQQRSFGLNEMCRRIETRWRTLLDEDAPHSIIDVDVTWSESRLGRWLSPPGGARGESDTDSGQRGAPTAAAAECGAGPTPDDNARSGAGSAPEASRAEGGGDHPQTADTQPI